MSEIRFVCGGIGHGKSLFEVIEGATELEKSYRYIVTNMELCLDEWAEYAHKYIKEPVEIRKRVRQITPAQARQCCLYLPERDLKDLSEVAARQGTDPGCLYIIDEVHLLFSARQWQSAGADVEKYMSQLRKLNDDLRLITQHPGKVDKNFRRNATEWLYVRSLARARLLFGVSIPGKFRWTVYSEEPQRSDKAEASGWFSVKDRGYGKLYNTMAGVGFSGINAVPEAQRKGGHWVRWIVAGVACVLVAVALPHVLGKGIGAAVGLLGSSARTGIAKSVGVDKMLSSNSAPAGAVVTAPAPASHVNVETEPEQLFLTGYSVLRGKTLCFLSDGSSAVADGVDERKGAWLNGRLVPWCKPPRSVGAPDLPTPPPFQIPIPSRIPKYDGPPIKGP